MNQNARQCGEGGGACVKNQGWRSDVNLRGTTQADILDSPTNRPILGVQYHRRMLTVAAANESKVNIVWAEEEGLLFREKGN